VYPYSSFNLVTEWGMWPTPRPGRLTPEMTRYPLYRALVVPTAFLGGCGNFFPAGIRSPDRPARSQSLYRIRYPGPLICITQKHSVCILQKTHRVSIIKTSLSVLFWIIRNTQIQLKGKMQLYFTAKPSGIYTDHWAFSG